MVERVSRDDLALLAAETARTPLHNSTLEIFEPGTDGFTYDDLLAHIEDRIAFVPRYRQLIRAVPGSLANPVWIDDPDFDVTYHVRRSAVPRPGSLDQLRDLAARIISRRLDRSRPLWELYFIEGLDGGRFAILSKSHQVLVDGVRTVDLGQVLLDVDPQPRPHVEEHWRPHRAPTPTKLMTDALVENLTDPATALQTAASTVAQISRSTSSLAKAAAEVAGALSNRRPHPDFAWNVAPSQQRRIVLVRTPLKAYRKVRRVHGGTVNDVILATIAGAVRAWLMTRAESVSANRRLRALVPMSVIDEDVEPTSLGSSVIGHRVRLPMGEASPVVRLHQVSYSLKAHSETGKAVSADRIAGVAGFAPTTFHALGTRVALREDHNVNLVVTNVPGPQFPMYLAGAQMVESFPLPPLQHSSLAIGVTSYDGSVSYGITADRDGLPDADVLGQCIVDALDELVDSASELRQRAPRGRKKAAPKPRPRSSD